MMAGKRFYMTASTAREHTNKLWENEGTFDEIFNVMRRSKYYLTVFLFEMIFHYYTLFLY